MTARLALVATGGTIANTLAGRIDIRDVVATVAEREGSFHPEALDVVEITRQSSEFFTPEEWGEIAATIERMARQPDVAGVIVTHGTYTVEESAYFAHLAVNTSKPIVFVCSQRRHGTIGNDGDRNLIDAVRVAGNPQAAGKGVLVVLNEEIHSAREVTKTSQRPGGFSSGWLGMLGSVESDRVSFFRSPTRRHTTGSSLGPPRGASLPRVDVVAAYAGADGAAIDAFVSAGARGLIVHGLAYGGVPHPNQYESLRRAADAGVAIVLTSRGGGGRVPKPTANQAFAGYISGDTLSAQKARVLLSLALLKSQDYRELQQIFDEY